MKMNKKITTREMILLGLLIILAAYYFMVQGPITNETEELEKKDQEVLEEIDSLQPYATQKARWEKELERIFAEADGQPETIADFDNTNAIIFELDTILGNAGSYRINFGDPGEADNIVTRQITVSFTDVSYESVVKKITAIRDSKNKYLIQDLVINENGSSDVTRSYSVTLKMADYEYKSAETK